MNKISTLTMKGLTGVRGGAKFLAALAKGDLADDAAVEARREVCRACPSRTRSALAGMTAESDWCGAPLVEALGASPPTCGCLVAGKTAVGSERCPQGKW